MKFALCIVAVAIMATVEAKPSPTVFSDNSYFQEDATLNSVQGAIIDIVSAATDLGNMESMLQDVASESTPLFAVEVAVEDAVDKTAYANDW